MSISPAQMILQVASAESFAPTRPFTPASAPVAATAANSNAESPAPARLSTDMQVDERHQVYYEFVDDRTGDVLFEIPPEALRAIGESLNVPLEGHSSVHNVDVKS